MSKPIDARRTPPGFPLSYILQYHHYSCTGCGRATTAEILMACERTSAANKAYHAMSANAHIYALPVGTTHTSFVTPRCEFCIAKLPRESVPLLPPIRQNQNLRATVGADIGPTMARHLASLAPAAPKTRINTLLDLDV